MVESGDPKRYELLFVDSAALTKQVELRKQRGIKQACLDGPWVDAGAWDQKAAPLLDDEKYIALRKHFIDGAPWEESGIFEHLARGLAKRRRVAASRGATGSFDGMTSEAEFAARYERVDSLHAQVAREGRLKTPWELDPGPMAQKYGIYVLLGRRGEVLFGGTGFHRLVIAQVLGLSLMPAALSIVHPEAISGGYLQRLRGERAAALDALGLNLPLEGLSVSPSLL